MTPESLARPLLYQQDNTNRAQTAVAEIKWGAPDSPHILPSLAGSRRKLSPARPRKNLEFDRPKPMTKNNSMKKLTVIPGEGIGPEIMNSAIQILQSVQAPFDFEFHDVGEVALRKHKHFFPEAAMAAIQRNSLVLKGPIATVNLKFMVADKFGFFSEVLTKQSAIANIGIISVFEPAHGPLPEIAGLGKANPTALIQSAVMLLEHIGEIKKAQSIFLALNSCAQDMGGKDNTHVFTKALIHKLNA